MVCRPAFLLSAPPCVPSAPFSGKHSDENRIPAITRINNYPPRKSAMNYSLICTAQHQGCRAATQLFRFEKEVFLRLKRDSHGACQPAA